MLLHRLLDLVLGLRLLGGEIMLVRPDNGSRPGLLPWDDRVSPGEIPDLYPLVGCPELRGVHLGRPAPDEPPHAEDDLVPGPYPGVI